MLDRDGVGVGVEVGQRLVLRHPGAVHLVREHELAGLVVELDDEVLAEVLQRHLRAEAGAEVPDLVGPLLELVVVGDAALERDRLVLRAAGRLAAGRRVAALAVLDHLGRALSAPTLLMPATYRPSHFTRNLKFLYGSNRCGVDGELGHHAPPCLAGDLLQPDDDELGRLQRREADHDVDDAEVDVVLRRRLGVALDEVRLARRRALERALPEQVVHERADVEPDLRPQRLVVRLEDDPLRAAEQRLLEEQRRAPDRQVLPLATRAGRRPRACARPRRVCPRPASARRQLTPSGLSRPISRSVSGIAQRRRRRRASRRARPAPSTRRASRRCARSSPAIAPHGANVRDLPVARAGRAR